MPWATNQPCASSGSPRPQHASAPATCWWKRPRVRGGQGSGWGYPRWYRATWQDIQQHRDGITLDAAGLPDLTRAIGKMLPPVSQEQQDRRSSEHRPIKSRPLELLACSRYTTGRTGHSNWARAACGSACTCGPRRGVGHAATQPGGGACGQRSRPGDHPTLRHGTRSALVGILPGRRCWLSASATRPTTGCAARAGGWTRW